MPLVGGIALCAAYLLVTSLLLPQGETFLPLVAGIAMLACGGLLDDLFDLSPRVRLLLQATAGLAVVFGAGLQLHSLGDLAGFGEVRLGMVTGVLFTLFCIVSLINGLNMLDGLDGLAGGVGAIMLGGFIVAAAMMGLTLQAANMTVFLCCLLGFLVMHNARSPLRRRLVFMGDAGSMVLGFLLACMAVYLAEHPAPRGMYPITAVWIMGLVVLDTIATVVRRALQRRSPLSPGRDHLHHLLLELGVPATRVVALMYVATAVLALVGLAGWFLAVPESVLTVAFVALSAVYYAAVARGWRRVNRSKAVVLSFTPRTAAHAGHDADELDVGVG